ncbi:TetR family transcriptional regulator [Streptosporangium sp. NPDC051023]|uniref:TetR/AcrR family transcriptional regulator n=1 Tax=Streptosporangium sp. NPDC051023 TaxID=3155410 RepID=UPI00344F0DDE
MAAQPRFPARRRSATVTRQAISEAARELFADSGFDAVGIRAIAARAGVDAALIIRYFGSKEQLFLEVMAVDLPVAAVMDGPLENLGLALVEHVLGLSSSASGTLAVTSLAALFQASERAPVQQTLRETIEKAFAVPLVGRLRGGDAELRAHLIAAQIGGLLTSLHVVQDPVLSGATRASLAAWYGAAIQRLIDGEDTP